MTRVSRSVINIYKKKKEKKNLTLDVIAVKLRRFSQQELKLNVNKGKV